MMDSGLIKATGKSVPGRRRVYAETVEAQRSLDSVGGTTEHSVWPESSEQEREQCHGKLVKKVKLDLTGQSPSQELEVKWEALGCN